MEYFMSRTNLVRFLFLVTACGLALAPAKASADLTAKANHDHIAITSFYHGSTVSVRGVCDPGADVIIKITSADGHSVLQEKGKAAGFLWMNVGALRFDHTPNLYFVQSSKKISDLINQKTADKFVLGFPALERHVNIEPLKDQAEKEKWFAEFVKFKEQNKLYSERNGKIAFANENGRRTYSMIFDWPFQAQPGEYEVEVFAVKDGKILEKAVSAVSVERAGAVKYLAALAKNNGAMYGVISVIVALISGFGAGMIFGKGGGAH